MNSLDEIKELKKQIANLPQGYISKKNINNTSRYYLQWTENGKKLSKYIKLGELDKIKRNIELRKELEKELAKYNIFETHANDELINTCELSVSIGENLLNDCKHTENFNKRKQVNTINHFLHDNIYNKVLILYGLRRTGKTTMIYQSILNMSIEDFQRTALITISPKNNLAQLNHDLKLLLKNNYKYVFIDEITSIDDFIEGAALLSDVFAPHGLKIILSGTDSLSFIFSTDDQLYDRAILLHTTFISYYEFEKVLNKKGIDNYIQYGGTMVIENTNYNHLPTFGNVESTNQYIDSSIATNIQHSLKCYQYGSHFRNLRDLYDCNQLTNVISRIVEEMNHRFALDVIIDDFKSHDLGVSSNNLRNDKENPSDILDHINVEKVTNILKNKLEIINKDEQKITVNNTHIIEIKEYLQLLDLIIDIQVKTLPSDGNKKYKTVFLQPGMRFSQAKQLIQALITDELYATIPIKERTTIENRILNEVKGRMMEDIVLFESQIAIADKSVFKLEFAVGEFDMVICDNNNLTCEIYEIKHSTEIDERQFKNLINPTKIEQTEFSFGKITKKSVIYRGPSTKYNDIDYINVEEYLKSLYE